VGEKKKQAEGKKNLEENGENSFGQKKVGGGELLKGFKAARPNGSGFFLGAEKARKCGANREGTRDRGEK